MLAKSRSPRLRWEIFSFYFSCGFSNCESSPGKRSHREDFAPELFNGRRYDLSKTLIKSELIFSDLLFGGGERRVYEGCREGRTPAISVERRKNKVGDVSPIFEIKSDV
ncbi:hypothetical protein AVEN_196905-1 [Araneus ventricosus]|uniref:Uncharacterized protein n=1 Tax=Araneus ventricosus TaxID=182803 RepID=A0A4Y2EFB7_ARAVE|nr:hypothetical protein AVEN_196905-1 [Araneus ventricosus]